MAVTIPQEPTPTLLGTADKIVYVEFEDSGLPTNSKFRYICQISLVGASTVVVAKLKQLPNSQDCGVFDFSGILRAYAAQDHNKHNTTTFAINGQALRKFYLKFYYEYASTADNEPVEYPAAALTKTVYVVNGTFTPVYNAYDTTNYDNYLLDDANAKFLSVFQPQEIVAQETDDGVVAMINGTTNAPWTSNPAYMHIAYYNGTTALNSGFITNPITPGGSNAATQFLVYFGIYPANLEAQATTALKPSNNANWTHYTVQASSSGTTLAGNETSTQYKITKKPECKYEAMRVAWWNELGGWDYYTFYSKHTHSEKITRNTFRQVGGNAYTADGSTTPFALNPYEGGLKVTHVETTNEWVLNTDPESESFNNVLDSLMNSPEVLWYRNGAWRGCVIKDTGIDFQSSINDKGIVYSVTIEESRYKPTI